MEDYNKLLFNRKVMLSKKKPKITRITKAIKTDPTKKNDISNEIITLLTDRVEFINKGKNINKGEQSIYNLELIALESILDGLLATAAAIINYKLLKKNDT
tara:strand:- start:642 stop:944 length:303 start_codon:yes stop_codon:yes gene_type:complete